LKQLPIKSWHVFTDWKLLAISVVYILSTTEKDLNKFNRVAVWGETATEPKNYLKSIFVAKKYFL